MQWMHWVNYTLIEQQVEFTASNKKSKSSLKLKERIPWGYTTGIGMT